MQRKHITIFGLARSGVASAKKLIEMGEEVFLTEEKKREEIEDTFLSEIKNLKAALELGGHTHKAINDSKLIVVSPGVPLALPILGEARKRGISIISEIELAYRFLKKPIVAITGTNGKTTTTTLVGEILKNGGKKIVVAGNIGYPLIEVDDQKLDFIVTEVSSYQLEGIVTFKPYVSAILNITPDHLQRHKTMEEYALAKSRIFMNQSQEEFLIYNMDNTYVSKLASNAKCKKTPFSRCQRLSEGVWIDSGRMIGQGEDICHLAEIGIKGEHNLENVLAAVGITLACGINKTAIAKTLNEFKGVEHRIEYVSTVDGINFVNDSKGTNPDSSIVALKTFGERIILIAGGRDKGTDLSEFCKGINKGVKQVVLIGEAQERFAKALKDLNYHKVSYAASLEEAVQKSFNLAVPGDTVLLSPACASFDMFKNFEERGRVFKEAVRCLNQKK